MIRNYFTIALRNLKKKKLYSGINLLGLSVGMACSILILLFVLNELSYDKFHVDHERIMRITETIRDKEGNIIENSASGPWSVGPTLQSDFPDAVVTRMYKAWQKDPLMVLQEEDVRFYEKNVFFVDSSFFSMFTFPLVRGNSDDVLANPQSVVLSETAASRYFGREDPVGKTIWLENKLPLTVKGVAKDAPANSHFHFDFLVPLLNIQDIFNATGNSWNFVGWYWNPVHTYIKLPEQLDREQFQAMLPEFINTHVSEQLREMMTFTAQPLADIHFTTNLYQELEPHRSKSSVYIAACIAIFILVIAAINFINLSTAMAMQRSKEVALRKVMGSLRGNLVFQFFGESILLCLFSLAIASVLVAIALPWFEALIGNDLNLEALITPGYIALTVGLTILFGVLAGFYPAILLSGFQPASILKSGSAASTSGGAILRKSLVVFQFAVSIILLISSFVVFNQHSFMTTKSLGIASEEIVMIPIRGTSIMGNTPAFKEQLQTNSGVLHASAVSDIIGEDVPARPFGIQGFDEFQNLPGIFTDHDFVKTFGLEILGGRDFEIGNEADVQSVIINESMAEFLPDSDWEGQNVGFGQGQRPIVGMVKDFNFMSVKQEIRPLLIGFSNSFIAYVAVRIQTDELVETMGQLESTWLTFEPEKPFIPFFLDDRLQQLYETEANAGAMIGAFSGLAIFIAFLGLVGLVTFTTNTRLREIGIRKVLGASAPNIVSLLSRNFLILVLIANIIAWPLAYELMDMWLSDFTYRIDMPWWLFAVAAVITFAIAFVTTGIQSFWAAQTNPVDTIRDE